MHCLEDCAKDSPLVNGQSVCLCHSAENPKHVVRMLLCMPVLPKAIQVVPFYRP